MVVRVRELASNATVTVGPGHTLRDAAQLMNKHRVGSAVVQDGEQLAGIITERDVLRAVAEGVDAGADAVSDHMSPDVITAGPDWDVGAAAATMIKHRVRHLVVYEGGQLLGVLSVRDLLPALIPPDQRGQG
jgi:CBS domain-containing protein